MDIEKYKQLLNEVKPYSAQIVAVSKTKPVEDVIKLHKAGHRIFGENKVQELIPKYEAAPHDIEWHLIGHLQTNKVKFIASFIGMIQSVDSLKLLSEINKQAERNNRVIKCLLQVSISEEETKFGISIGDLYQLLESPEYAAMKNIQISGLMGVATHTIDEVQIEKEFGLIKGLFDHIKKKYFADNDSFRELSLGMTSDYKLALKHGATLIRIGSLIFGERVY